MWWFCLLYSVTFGGYVGLSSFLPTFLHDQYGVNAVQAGVLTALIAFVGSATRPFGGWLADRLGGVRMLSVLLIGIIVLYMLGGPLPALHLAVPLLIIQMACLGMGNGAVFQLVPQRFGKQIGVATGFIGAFGGLGGFFLPNLLGIVKQQSGSFGLGFMTLALIAAAALMLLRGLVARHDTWRLTWRTPATMEGELA
jgi:NNP family nitrate/nitrite transporter-like MFS transporter